MKTHDEKRATPLNSPSASGFRLYLKHLISHTPAIYSSQEYRDVTTYLLLKPKPCLHVVREPLRKWHISAVVTAITAHNTTFPRPPVPRRCATRKLADSRDLLRLLLGELHILATRPVGRV